jgi:two-component system chemotaxis sensor kinase CheA
LSNVFRVIHTIKGTCGSLGFVKLESVAHVGENILSQVRDGHLSLRPEITSALLALVDAIREILRNIDSDGVEGTTDYSELTQSLLKLLNDRVDVGPNFAVPLGSRCTAKVCRRCVAGKRAFIGSLYFAATRG